MPKGWPIVGWVALGLGVMCVAITALSGTDETAVRLVLRATARTSVVLFLLAFTASALQRTWPTPASRWLVANRRYLGVSFATSHFVHLMAILTLAGWSLARLVEMTAAGPLVLGALAYAFIAAMTATSFDRTAAWLGPRRWQRLHTVGAWTIWLVFTLTFVPLTLRSVLYWPFALLLVAAPALRMGLLRSARIAVPASSR